MNRTVAIWWSEVAWVSVDREKFYVQQGSTPWEALDYFVTGALAMAEWNNVDPVHALDSFTETPPDLVERFEDASLLPPKHFFVPDKSATYLAEVSLAN